MRIQCLSKYYQRDLENLCSALSSDIAVLRTFWNYLRQIGDVPNKSSRIFISQFSRGVLIAKLAFIWNFQKGRQILVLCCFILDIFCNVLEFKAVSKYDQRDLENLCSALPLAIAVLRVFWNYLRQVCKVPITSSRIFISKFSSGILIAKLAYIWNFPNWARQILVKT